SAPDPSRGRLVGSGGTDRSSCRRSDRSPGGGERLRPRVFLGRFARPPTRGGTAGRRWCRATAARVYDARKKSGGACSWGASGGSLPRASTGFKKLLRTCLAVMPPNDVIGQVSVHLGEIHPGGTATEPVIGWGLFFACRMSLCSSARSSEQSLQR